MADSRLETLVRVYDGLAPDYESQLVVNPVAGYMRAQLHEHFGRVFKPGDRVVDLAAGTGFDAVFLASHGIQVIALDASPGMIKELECSARAQDLSIGVHILPVERLGDLELADLDGAISCFGGLNTVDEIGRLASELARSIKPGGRVIFHALGDFCLWQTCRSLAHGRLQIARTSDFALGNAVIAHRLHNADALWRSYFERNFERREAYALSVVAAPVLVKRFPSVSPTLFALDRIMGRLLPSAGDFFVLDMERRVV